MTDFAKFLLKAFLRKGLTVAGTWLLAHGYLTNEEAGGFVSQYLEEVLGAVMLAGAGLWTYTYNRYVKKKTLTALKLPENSTPADLRAALGESESK